MEDDKVVGYAGMWHVVTEGHITNIAVHKDYRGKGVGQALVKGLIDIAKEKEMIGVTLEVRPSNETALHIYSKIKKFKAFDKNLLTNYSIVRKLYTS